MLLLIPDNLHIVTRIAELYYTLGGEDNYNYAKKYYSFVLQVMPKNMRATWGLRNSLFALESLSKSSEVDKKLLQIVKKKIEDVYNGKLANYLS